MGSDADLTLMLRLARISAELIAEPEDVEAIARSIVSKAIDFIPGCEAAVVTKRERSKLTLVAATDERAAACVDRELALRCGPTITAVWQSEVTVVDTIGRDVRWPGWAREAQDQRMASALSLRLASGDDRLGALTVLSTRPHHWSPWELSLATAYTTHASCAMHTAMVVSAAHVTTEARHRIGVAQGILMQRYGLTKEAAFSLLQRYSNVTNVKVRDLADQVSKRRDLPPMPGRILGSHFGRQG